MTTKYETREAWLEAAVVRLSRLFKAINVEIPPVRVSVGWPSKGGLSTKSPVIGQCWKADISSDGVPQIFISPTLGQHTLDVLATLVHELIHAWDDCESGHKGEFARVAKLIGLQGKMTKTYVDAHSDLGRTLEAVIQDVGAYPHAALITGEMQKQRPKQTTRMLKLVTHDCCDYTVRTTAKWIEDVGLPMCPHGVTMEQDQ